MRKRVDKASTAATAASHESHLQGSERELTEENRLPSLGRRWLKRGLLAFCAIFPIALQYILPDLTQRVVYSYGIRLPFFVDLNQPADLLLNHTVNMYLASEEGVSLGVWHTVPESQWKEAQGKDLAWYQNSLGNGAPVVIYLHGNGGTRAAPHRVGVANLLSALGYHALVLDYRGFADSTGQPTEAGLTTDALYLYQWVKARCGNSLVVIWGQSLGTGVTTNTAVKLLEQGKVVDGVILEAAFTNSQQEAADPIGWFFKKIPSIGFLNTMADNSLFPSDDNLRKMRSSILFLYSEDDTIVPTHMSQQLYQIALSVQNPDRVKIVSFSGSHGYKHNGLYKDPQTPGIIKMFMQSL